MSGFRLHMPVTAWEKSGDDYPMRIGGIMSTDSLDREGEEVVQDGLNFAPFLKHGWFNDNHGQKATDALGYPTDVKRVRKGDVLPNGAESEHNGWWGEGYLLNTDEGRKVFSMVQALHKNEHRRLGFSVEGGVTSRAATNRKKVLTAVVRHCAITHVPINTDTGVEALSKALSAGHGVASGDLGSGEAGSAGPLRAEAVEVGKPYTLDEREDELQAGLDQVNGGLSPVAKSETGKPAQGDDNSQPELTDVQYVEQFADSIAAAVARTAAPDHLTKAEARIIVRNRHPKLSAAQADALVARASSAAGGS
tara:strand:+ start:7212 stop:8135 length:924 start_codon:yes stop_codon:yes gene_type:complete